jgi:tetratricopeptide (TPR) repeat protein
MHSLANVYRDSGRLADAIPLYEEVLTRYQKTLGSENVDTINSISNLATAYQSVGRMREAVALFERAQEDYMTTLGPEHVSTVIGVNNLANAYRGWPSDSVMLSPIPWIRILIVPRGEFQPQVDLRRGG